MKRRPAQLSSCSSSSSSSSNNSSSCIVIVPPLISKSSSNDAEPETNNKSAHLINKPKRLRAKKIHAAHNSPAHTTSPKSRSSIYRGVTRHRWTGRFEAHLWDKATWNNIQNKRGRQIYLGAYDNEEDAARTYDLAAIKYWGPTTILNFPVESYPKQIEEMQKMTSNEEYLATLRRRSSGFSRGVSKYRGVARHHHNGRWEARIGRVAGNKYLYLGTYSTQEEAAAAYDMAAIEFRGPNAITNFDINNYADKLKKIDLPAVAVAAAAAAAEWQSKDQHHHVQLLEEETCSPTDHEYLNQVKAVNDDVQALVIQPSCIAHDESQVVMELHNHEHPWDIYLDTAAFNSLPLSTSDHNIPLEKSSSDSEVLGWLDSMDFEDDIECIFDGLLSSSSYENNDFFLQDDAVSGSGGGDYSKKHDLSTSLSSSSLSTMASVCSNIY